MAKPEAMAFNMAASAHPAYHAMQMPMQTQHSGVTESARPVALPGQEMYSYQPGPGSYHEQMAFGAVPEDDFTRAYAAAPRIPLRRQQAPNSPSQIAPDSHRGTRA